MRQIFTNSSNPSNNQSAPFVPAITTPSTGVLTIENKEDYDTASFIYDTWLPLVEQLRSQGVENNYQPWGIRDTFSAVDWIGHQIPKEIIDSALVYVRNPKTNEIVNILGRKWFAVPSDISQMQLRIMPDTRSTSSPSSVRCFIEFKYILEGSLDANNNSISSLGRMQKGSDSGSSSWGKWRVAVTFNQESVDSGLISSEDLSTLFTYYETMCEYGDFFYKSNKDIMNMSEPESSIASAIKSCVLRIKATTERKNVNTVFFRLGIDSRITADGEYLDERVSVTDIIWKPGAITLFGKVGFSFEDNKLRFISYNEGGSRPSLPIKLDPSSIEHLGLY